MAINYTELINKIDNSSDFNYISSLVDNYLENNDKEFLEFLKNDSLHKKFKKFKKETVELIIKMSEIKQTSKDNKYQDMYTYIVVDTLYRLKTCASKAKQEGNNFGLGFVFIEHDETFSTVDLKKHAATWMLSDIFFMKKPSFVKYLKNKFKNYEDLKKYGINNCFIDYIKNKDVFLADFCMVHPDLIDTNLITLLNIQEVFNEDYDVISERVNFIYRLTVDLSEKQTESLKKITDILAPQIHSEIEKLINEIGLDYSASEIIYYCLTRDLFFSDNLVLDEEKEAMFNLLWKNKSINTYAEKEINIDLKDFNQRRLYNEALEIIMPRDSKKDTDSGLKVISFQKN